MFDDSLQRGHKGSPLSTQFTTVMERKLTQNFLSFRSQFKQDFAVVLLPTLPANVAFARQAVYQLDRAVVTNLQALGHLTDAGTRPFG